MKSLAVFVVTAVLGAFAADQAGVLGLLTVGALMWFVGRIVTEWSGSKREDGGRGDEEKAAPAHAVSLEPPASNRSTDTRSDASAYGEGLFAARSPSASPPSSVLRALVDTGWGRLYVVVSLAWLAWRIYAVYEVAMDEWGNWRASDSVNVLLTGLVLPVVVGAAWLWVARGFRRSASGAQ